VINKSLNLFSIQQKDDELSRYLSAWKSGVLAEVKFWDAWLEQRGGRWKDEFLTRFAADAPLQLQINPTSGETVRILDVGSGPVTNIGYRLSGTPVDIVAVDPLAVIYSSLLNKYRLTPPVPTILGFAEDLSSQFDSEVFDVIHCRNALDHSYDPVRGLQEMLLVAKVSGSVILHHAANEAINAAYDGLHQWNFDEQDSNFIIYNKSTSYNITELAKPFADVKTTKVSNWVSVHIKKIASINIDMNSRHRQRNMTLLRGIMHVLTTVG